MDAVRTPLDNAPMLALGNRRFRKEVLKLGDVHYAGGTFPVTPDYLHKVVTAFDSGAIKRVPFQLADASNSHTEDPLRRFGTVLALHQTDNGLDAVIELDEEAARLVEKDPEFGVSVLIKHDRTTGEGQRYDAVLAHVLGTTDPVLTSLAPWQPELAASQDSGQVLDLLALTAPRDPQATPPGADPDPKEKPPVATTLTDEQAATLDALAALLPTLSAQYGINKPTPPAPAAPVVAPAAAVVQPADPTPGPAADTVPEPTADPDPAPEPDSDDEGDPDEAEFTQAELDAMAAALIDDAETTTAEAVEPELVAASHGNSNSGGNATDPDSLQLSHDLRAERQARENLELRLAQVERERDDRAYTLERDRMARDLGIAPRLTDIIAPLLRGTGQQIALANGQSANAGDLVRKFVRELSTVGFLDLSLSQGTPVDVDVDKAADEATARQAAAAAYVAALNG
jgi:hypothetical protein